MSKDSIKSPHGGIQGIIDMLRVMPADEQAKLITNLAARDPELAKQLREKLPRFEDITKLSAAELQEIFRQMPTRTIAISFRGMTPELLADLLNKLPKRLADEIKEQIQDIGPQPMNLVKEAQNQVAGQISIIRKGK